MTTLSRYRKKPVVIEAMRLGAGNGSEVAAWCGGRPYLEAKPSDHDDVAVWVDIPTLEGVMRANAGDYVIRGFQGEFYPCRSDIFMATYEEVADDSVPEVRAGEAS